MLHSKKKIKRYCKLTLNVFFYKNIFNDDKTSDLYDIFFISNRNFTTENIKIVKNPRFFWLNC